MSLDDLLEFLSSPRVIVGVFVLILLALIPIACSKGELREAGPFGQPIQTEMSYLTPLGVFEDFEIFATDEYEISAVILSRKRYWFDAESDLSPVDFLLGWGPVTLEPNISKIEWSQSGRWGNYRYRYEDITINQNDIAQNTANTHIIPDPDQPNLRSELLGLRRGDSVRLVGYLVKIYGENGWRWESSRSRNDTGGGACEVFFVTDWEPLDTE